MGMKAEERALGIIFLPPALNLAFSFIVGYMAYLEHSSLPIGVRAARMVYTYGGVLWGVFEGIAVALALREVGAGWLREKYRRGGAGDAALAAALAAATWAILFSWQVLNAYMYGGWERYSEYWRLVVGGVPLWARLYMAAVAPFVAGFFEEVLWRGYGLDVLEPRLGRGWALALQAVAFGLMHGPTLYAAVAAVIGYLYGLAYYRAGRRLLPLSAAHVVVDLVGFWAAFMWT